MFKKRKNKGFTIVELSIMIGVFVVLAVGVFSMLNPTKRLGQANNTQRWEDLTALAKAVELYQIDNAALPSDLADASMWNDQKKVLCSSPAELDCDGQARDCLVVNDSDFLGEYIDVLPIDPIKSVSTDTGYYITRTGDDMMTFGACSTYNEEEIELVAKASLADHSSTCGDEEITGNEVCDDGPESCGDGTVQSGTYCNDTCTANDKSMSEGCDYNSWSKDCDDFVDGWLTYSDVGGRPWCNSTCQTREQCIVMP
ncbi:MAG: hypothetical protein HOE19_02570 [Candidatus Komeilibacteria bacterium]|jgi:type II secretory pathway pseudopilin PulG|nr:hypothetical protein [Candidatus Komeilibacteria bacterium]MBT4447293.1 hypothetical protein [Candidatus Komeilibacteria bacterium]